MLEILCLVWLCRSIGNNLRAKGRRPGWYQFLAVLLYFVGLFTGALAGALLETGNIIYVFTLAGGVFGALTGYTIASLVKPARSFHREVGPVFD